MSVKLPKTQNNDALLLQNPALVFLFNRLESLLYEELNYLYVDINKWNLHMIKKKKDELRGFHTKGCSQTLARTSRVCYLRAASI